MAKKEQPQAQTPELFTVYYMNQDKVFEMRMLLDNRLQTGHTGEQTGSTSSEANISTKAGAKVPFLTELQGNIEGKIGHEKQTKMVDTLEYIHTKSRMLSDIIARCNIFEGNSANEGDLVYIDDVNLELLNEDEVRALVAIMTGTFDGFTVPEAGGLDIGHMFQSIVKAGASFKLRGEAGHGCGGPILLKIPIDSGSLFESGYSIDDLLIGKVGVVGICKGKVKRATCAAHSITSRPKTSSSRAKTTASSSARKTRAQNPKARMMKPTESPPTSTCSRLSRP